MQAQAYMGLILTSNCHHQASPGAILKVPSITGPEHHSGPCIKPPAQMTELLVSSPGLR